jgi:hypothetical protein
MNDSHFVASRNRKSHRYFIALSRRGERKRERESRAEGTSEEDKEERRESNQLDDGIMRIEVNERKKKKKPLNCRG